VASDGEIRSLISNSTLSDGFKQALLSALDRDPKDAAADAGLLSIVLDQRANSLEAYAQALKEILETKRSGPM
jgi:hypothetical protein